MSPPSPDLQLELELTTAQLATYGHNGHQDATRSTLRGLILSKVCSSQWSLKARAVVAKRSPDGHVIFKLRNYRVLHGQFEKEMRTVEVTVPASVANDLKEGSDQRQRYYLMGRTNEGGEHVATLAIPWPHKMGQFR